MNQEDNRSYTRPTTPKMVSEHQINKKLRKIRRKFKRLYPEYKKVNMTKCDNDKIEQLITKLSKIEYKYIQYLKLKYNYK